MDAVVWWTVVGVVVHVSLGVRAWISWWERVRADRARVRWRAVLAVLAVLPPGAMVSERHRDGTCLIIRAGVGDRRKGKMRHG